MTNEELKDKQEETLNQLKKYNKERKTEIIDDRSIASVDEVAKLQNEVSSALTNTDSESNGIEGPRDFFNESPSFAEEKPLISHICPYCGQLAYQNQLHGLGYCREKAQYEQ